MWLSGRSGLLSIASQRLSESMHHSELAEQWMLWYESCNIFRMCICMYVCMPMSILCLISTEQEGCTHTGKLLEEFFCPYIWVEFHWLAELRGFGFRHSLLHNNRLGDGISFTVTIIISVSYIPWISNELAQDSSHIGFTLALVFVSVACSGNKCWMNAMVVDYFFFRSKKLCVFNVVMDCFQDNRFAVITTILGALLIINSIYAFTTDNIF